MALAAFWGAAVVLLGTRGWAGPLAVAVTPAFTLMVGVGNVNSLLLAGLVGAWLLRDRPVVLGILLGALVSLKLTPAVLVIWLLGTRRWRALAWTVGTLVILGIATAWLLGPRVLLDYVGVMQSVSGSRPLSTVILVVGLGLVGLVGRRFPRATFALAVMLVPLGSPVAAGHTWALLLAAAAPAIRADPLPSISSLLATRASRGLRA